MNNTNKMNNMNKIMKIVCIAAIVILFIIVMVSTPSSKKSSSSSWHKVGDTSVNDNGYAVYELPNGTKEISDGYGNYAQDRDGDGKLDYFGSDN